MLNRSAAAFRLLLAVLALFVVSAAFTGCEINRSSQDFQRVFGARYLPQPFTSFGGVEYNYNGQTLIRYAGAYRLDPRKQSEDELLEGNQYAVVWAEYTQDRRGNWYRHRYDEEPIGFAKTLDESRELARRYLQNAPFRDTWADKID